MIIIGEKYKIYQNSICVNIGYCLYKWLGPDGNQYVYISDEMRGHIRQLKTYRVNDNNIFFKNVRHHIFRVNDPITYLEGGFFTKQYSVKHISKIRLKSDKYILFFKEPWCFQAFILFSQKYPSGYKHFI